MQMVENSGTRMSATKKLATRVEALEARFRDALKPTANDEIARLSKENIELRRTLADNKIASLERENENYQKMINGIVEAFGRH
jgi:hypothetical protein